MKTECRINQRFLNLRDIEQGLEQMKRLPLKDVKVPLIPSEKPGFTGIVLNVMQGCNVYESITFDDSGCSFRARGRARGCPRAEMRRGRACPAWAAARSLVRGERCACGCCRADLAQGVEDDAVLDEDDVAVFAHELEHERLCHDAPARSERVDVE